MSTLEPRKRRSRPSRDSTGRRRTTRSGRGYARRRKTVAQRILLLVFSAVVVALMVVEIVTVVRSSSEEPTKGRGNDGGGSAPLKDDGSSASRQVAEQLVRGGAAASNRVQRGGAEMNNLDAHVPREETLRRRRIGADLEVDEEEHDDDDGKEREEASGDDGEKNDEAAASGDNKDGGDKVVGGENDDGNEEEEVGGVDDGEEEEEGEHDDDGEEEEEERGGDDDEAAGDDAGDGDDAKDNENEGEVQDDGDGDDGNGDDDEAAGDDDDENNNGDDGKEGGNQDDGDDDQAAKDDDDEGQSDDQNPNEGGGGGGGDELGNDSPQWQQARVQQPRRSLEEVLTRAGVEVTPELKRKLPPAEEAEWMYYGRGDGEPVVLGLDTCEEFRNSVKGEDRFIAVAGMFNTGTNLLSDLLVNNCYLPEKVKKFGEKKIGMRGQVPWGKHSPMSWRGHHVAEGGADDVVQTDVLPAVVVKDPLTWMTSMCRHKYAANWHHTEGHCPNLVPVYDEEKNDELVQSPEGGNGKTIPVHVKYRETKVTKHESLAGLWNDWYRPWAYEAAFPRIIVRFEDLLLRAEEVVGTVCRCGGGEMREEFQYDVETAKHGVAHKGANGMTSAIVRYTNATLRLEPFHERDLRYANEALRPDLMEAFGYRYGVKRS